MHSRLRRHYIGKEDHEAHEVLLSIQTKDQIDNPDRFSFGNYQVHVRTTEEILNDFKDTLKHRCYVEHRGNCRPMRISILNLANCSFPNFQFLKHTHKKVILKLVPMGLKSLKQKRLNP